MEQQLDVQARELRRCHAEKVTSSENLNLKYLEYGPWSQQTESAAAREQINSLTAEVDALHRELDCANHRAEGALSEKEKWLRYIEEGKV